MSTFLFIEFFGRKTKIRKDVKMARSIREQINELVKSGSSNDGVVRYINLSVLTGKITQEQADALVKEYNLD